MTIARLIVEEALTPDADAEVTERELGIYEFVELPSEGQLLGVQYDMDFNYLRVNRVLHFPIPHPFEPDPDLPSLQQTEPSAHVIVQWVGIG